MWSTLTLSLSHTLPPSPPHLQSNLNTSDFAELSAPLLYDMFKAHSEYPLHLAIQHQREDVVFLFLIEFNAQVRTLTVCYMYNSMRMQQGASWYSPLPPPLKNSYV